MFGKRDGWSLLLISQTKIKCIFFKCWQASHTCFFFFGSMSVSLPWMFLCFFPSIFFLQKLPICFLLSRVIIIAFFHFCYHLCILSILFKECKTKQWQFFFLVLSNMVSDNCWLDYLSGGVFKLELFLPEEYPMTPPKVLHYHCNLD